MNRYVVATVLVLSATVLVLEGSVMAERTFDHERLDVYRLSIDYVAFSYRIARPLRGVNRQADPTKRRCLGRGIFPSIPQSRYMKLFFLCCVLCSFMNDKVSAQSGEFRSSRYKSMEYQLFEPQNLSEHDRVPLVVGLHGAGKRKMQISQILMHFHTIPATPKFQETFPCYILAPKTTKSWFPQEMADPELTSEQLAELPPFWKDQYAETINQRRNPPKGGFGDQEILFDLIDKLVAEKKIDSTRIYIVGFSMGGTGTWQAIATRPNFFSAAIPVAGGRLFPWQWNKEVLSVPIWAFQGSEDGTTVADRHRTLFEHAKTLDGNMKYTEFQGAGHSIVEYAFSPSGKIRYDKQYETTLSSDACDKEENVWKWLFSQRRNDDAGRVIGR